MSYDPALTAAKDRVRFALGDTDPAAELLTDQTIVAMLDAYPEAEATARLAEGLASRYAQEPDTTTEGDVTFSWKDRVGNWRRYAASIRAQQPGAAGSASPMRVVRRSRFAVDSEPEYTLPRGPR